MVNLYTFSPSLSLSLSLSLLYLVLTLRLFLQSFSILFQKYFQTVVFGIEGIPEKRLSTMQLLNLEQQRDREQDQEQGGSQQPSQELSKREKEELLKVFVKDGWLSVSNNFYSVGPRTSLELKSLIESQINVNAA